MIAMMGKTFDSVWEGQQSVVFFMFAAKVTNWDSFDSVPPPFSLLAAPYYLITFVWSRVVEWPCCVPLLEALSTAGRQGFKRLIGKGRHSPPNDDVVPMCFELETFPNGCAMPGATVWAEEYPPEGAAGLPKFVEAFVESHMEDDGATGDDDEVRWRAHLMKTQWRLKKAQEKLQHELITRTDRISAALEMKEWPTHFVAPEVHRSGSSAAAEAVAGESRCTQELAESAAPPPAAEQPPPSGVAPLRTRGFLIKHPVGGGHMFSSPRRRLFDLSPGLLRWYEDDAASNPVRGEMVLDSATVVEARPEGAAGAADDGSMRELVVRSTMRTTVQELVLSRSPGDDGSLAEWKAAISACIVGRGADVLHSESA